MGSALYTDLFLTVQATKKTKGSYSTIVLLNLALDVQKSKTKQ